jgi:hypothetical protein
MESNEGTFGLKKNLINIFLLLPDDKAGQLIKHIFQFVNGEEPINEDLIVNLAFDPIKKDLIKNRDFKMKCSEAGKKSASIKKEQKSTLPQGNVKVRSRPRKGMPKVQSTLVQGTSTDLKVPQGTLKLDHQKIIAIFNSVCTDLPRATLTDERVKMIDRILKTYSLEQIGQVFKNARDSDFINGKVSKWRANLNWILNPNNFVKVLEGNYVNINIAKEEQFVDRAQKTSDAVDRFYEINGH